MEDRDRREGKWGKEEVVVVRAVEAIGGRGGIWCGGKGGAPGGVAGRKKKGSEEWEILEAREAGDCGPLDGYVGEEDGWGLSPICFGNIVKLKV